jgi:hypothetical protein
MYKVRKQQSKKEQLLIDLKSRHTFEYMSKPQPLKGSFKIPETKKCNKEFEILIAP